MSSGYHNLQLDEKSSYLITFACQCGRYRYKRLPFGADPAGDMFQRKKNRKYLKIYQMYLAFQMTFLILGYDVEDHDDTLQSVLQICRQVNLKLSKGKCHFRCILVPYFGEVIFSHSVKPDPQKPHALTEMPPPKTKKEPKHSLE